jgi:serine/threonine-protein phosphatase PGAM5
LVYASPLTRARETAEIVGKAIGKKPEILRELAECTPPTTRQDIMARMRPGELDTCASQIETVFTRFFRGTTGPDSTVALVCHGNVTRYLISRALGLDPKLWLNFSISHASVSKVRVRPDGAMQVIAVGESGYLPPEMVTFTNPPPPKADSAKGGR